MINFDGKLGRGSFKFWSTSDDITDMLTTSYDEPTAAMRQLTQHLLPAPAKAEESAEQQEPKPEPVITTDSLFADENPVPPPAEPAAVPQPTAAEVTAAYDWSNVTFDIAQEASKSPLDGAIAAAIASAGTENKIKTASTTILLIGGTSALKGLNQFISER